MTIELIEPTPDLAPLWYTWRNEWASLRYNPLDPLDVSYLRLRLQDNGTDFNDREALEYRWFVRANGVLVGQVNLHNISWRNRHAEVGYHIAEGAQGQGFGTAAVRLLLQKAFFEGKFFRIMALIHTENEPSIKLVRRIGFQYEGTLRKHFLIQGRWADEAVYALLRDEFTASA